MGDRSVRPCDAAYRRALGRGVRYKASFFATCDRDAGGHCKPGSGDGTGDVPEGTSSSPLASALANDPAGKRAVDHMARVAGVHKAKVLAARTALDSALATATEAKKSGDKAAIKQSEAAVTAAYRAEQEAKAEARKAVHAELKKAIHGDGGGSPITVNPQGRLGSTVEKSLADATDFLNGLASASVARPLTIFPLSGPGRDHCVPGEGVYLRSTATPATIAHEWGHELEADPAIKAAAQSFLAMRVGDEPPTPLASKYPGCGYRSDEVGVKDDFGKAFADDRKGYYVGKAYASGHTEILSMGIELLYTDAAGFAERDPEYFRFVVGVLAGRIKG